MSQRRVMSLSPSRASDFRSCPLLYRLRAIDRLPEPMSEAQARGLMVHGVLERLYGGLLPADRTLDAAESLIDASAEALVGERPEAAELVADGDFKGQVEKLLREYFRKVEDPTRLLDVEVERLVEATTAAGVPVKGFIDRLDRAPDGSLRVNDYKTGRAPSPDWEDNVLYQLKVYALLLWLASNTVPAILRVVYLSPASTLELTVDEDDLRRFERRLTAVWTAILKAGRTGDFRPSPSRMCSMCSFHKYCPAKGGTPPPYPGWPEEAAA